MTLLRAYPTISDFLRDALGIDIPLGIFSFGFFVALGFLAAAWVMLLELRRKEKQGIFEGEKVTVVHGKPATTGEIAVNAIFGFIIGFKVVAVFFNYQACALDPQGFIFSLEGNFIGGILGALIGGYIRYREKEKQKLEKPKEETVTIYPSRRLGDIVVTAAIAGFLGAKIFNFFEAPGAFREFLEDPGSNLFSGLTIYGGLIMGAAGVIWYARKHKIKILPLADAVAPGLILAYGIGRLGCHVSGDGDWGIANPNPKPDWLAWLPDGLWSNNYAHNILGEGEKIANCSGPFCYELQPGVYPTPIYETIMALIIFGILWAVRKNMPAAGMLMGLYLVFNGIERFFIEKIRVNTEYDLWGMTPTQAEIISPIFVLGGIVMMWLCWKYAKRKGNGSEIDTSS